MGLSSVFCESGMRWCTFDCCKLNVRGKLLAISIIVRCIKFVRLNLVLCMALSTIAATHQITGCEIFCCLYRFT